MGAGLERDDAPVREGDVLAGRYRVERVLAAGGMGIVVAAKHIQLNQRVAVKVLTHNIKSSQANARFLTEAKASALLKSDHVIHVSDVGTLDNGQPFMVMELLEGDDLAQALDREGKFAIDQAVDYVLQACEGLAEAHAAKIVHRDLKPGNLFRARRPDGSDIVKVLDFGVSKALSTDVRAEGTVTTTDAVFGSPLYMSPEQMQSASKADERSDIWSLGVVLYELLTRRMPFDAESMAGLAVRIATDPPTRLVEVLPGAPLPLEGVVFKCLAKNPDDRYSNVAELAADLEPFAPDSRARVERIQRIVLGSTIPPRPVPSAPSLRKLAVGAETLGPLDAGEHSSATVLPNEKRRRASWPLVAGIAIACVSVVSAAMFVKQSSSSRAGNAAQPVTTLVAAQSAEMIVAHTDTQATTASAQVAATTASSTTKPHTHHDPALGLGGGSGGGSGGATTTSTHVQPPASAPVLTGISRDRK